MSPAAHAPAAARQSGPYANIAVRAVTAFVVLKPEPESWAGVLDPAIRFCASLATSVRAAGYVVQSLRVITNPFGEYLDTTTAETAVTGIQLLQELLKSLEVAAQTRVRFSIGAATTRHELALVPELIKQAGDLANSCVNIPVSSPPPSASPASATVAAAHNPVLDYGLVTAAAEVCARLGRETPHGEGNFNFTINFNGPDRCPYFPAGFNTSASGQSFVLGLEYPDLLAEVLERVRQQMIGQRRPPSTTAAAAAAAPSPPFPSPNERGAFWARAAAAMSAALEGHVETLTALARAAEAASGSGGEGGDGGGGDAGGSAFAFAGVDSSPAPSKAVTSMCRVVELLGVPHFGASGTTEACAFLTRVFKGVRAAPLVGFSGLMFACLEDRGLAAAAAAGHYDIRALLQYSAVCGIGLDTVPVPGNTSVAKMARLACDCGALAFRLNKPLTVRLFPAPGLAAGDVTQFESDDLCNCRVFEVP